MLQRLFVKKVEATVSGGNKNDDDKKDVAVVDQKQRIYRMKMLNKSRPKTLVLDLDETLVHSSAADTSTSFVSRFDGSQQAQGYTYKLDLYITDVLCTFFVSERPHVHVFMDFVCCIVINDVQGVRLVQGDYFYCQCAAIRRPSH